MKQPTMMMKKTLVAATLAATLLSACGDGNNAPKKLYTLDDAQRFAQLIADPHAEVSVADVQNYYLDVGTRGIEIFTPGRIVDAERMQRTLLANRKHYERAVSVCLPAAEAVETEALDVLARAAQLLQQDDVAPIYMVFGAFNSGGTIGRDGLVLGLEVICRLAEDQAQAEALITDFVAHEIVHVYQMRNVSKAMENANPTLLSQSLVEGFADYVAERLQGRKTPTEQQRYDYVVAHEAELWQQFQQAMDSADMQPWLYAGEVDGKPADLGYSIGKRIIEAYVANSGDEQQALQDILSFSDPQELLRKSGYAP